MLENWQRAYFKSLGKKGVKHSPLHFKEVEEGKFEWNPSPELEKILGRPYSA
jgi:hypothetical protein